MRPRGVEKTPAGRFLWARTLAFAVEAGQQPPLVWAGSPVVLILVACLVVQSFVEGSRFPRAQMGLRVWERARGEHGTHHAGPGRVC